MRRDKRWEELEERMLDMLRTEAMPLEEMGKELGLNPKETEDLLRQMKEDGLIQMGDIPDMN